MDLYNKPSPDELIHEGVKGQKWGERNGPPYPLSANQISSAEKKAGTKVSDSAKERDGVSTPKSSSKKDSKNKFPRSAKKMSDSDLKKNLQRLKDEKQYKDLVKDLYGHKIAREVGSSVMSGLNKALTNAVSDIGTRVMKHYVNVGVDKLLKQSTVDSKKKLSEIIKEATDLADEIIDNEKKK